MSPAWFDGGQMLPPARGTSRERHAARLTCARAAQGDADNLRLYLNVLALWPAQDVDVTYTDTPTVWGADYISRRSGLSD